MLARGVAFFILETLIYVPSYGRIVYLVCPVQVADAPFGRMVPHSRRTIGDLFIYFVIPWRTNLLYIGEKIIH